MHRAHRITIAALVGLGVALAIRPLPADAAAGDGVMSGPVVAIAKARAAAKQAERRAAEHDAQAAKTFADDAPRGTDSQPATADANGTPSAAAVARRATSATHADAPQNDGQHADAHHAEAALPTYDPSAHRDPFRPPRLTGTADAKTPLETYQLGQLKLVGVVVESSSGYRAMVEDSAGLGYIITTGTPIGSSGGVVRSIEPRRVVIEESTRDFYGDVKPKEVVMELPQEDRSP